MVDPTHDLVDDRAITNAAADHFGHAEFAAQAASTIKTIRTPSNIAIYAPWGSGKTSLANLLREELHGDDTGFIYFDAFKYAEAPLRREFIRRVAKDLKVDDSKFDRGLYEERVDSGLNLSGESFKGILVIVCCVGTVAVVLALALAYVVALASGKAIGPQWVDAVKVFVPAFFAPAVIIAPLIIVIGDKLNYSRTRFAPQSDEEFERLFRDLVDAARKKQPKWSRLVIFIDELDRCGADEVASTLETLRTFLEVEHCVFVVAADRAVLETAVAKESRQQTPYNDQNPYYSAGSSYLDKIFQYQWQLPPMLPSSLSRFAEGLVKDLPGLWTEVNPGEVVSVLVPLHVQSPRRVKELLNAYAMAYRFAERRIADHHLDGDIRGRAAELAKLVCLQMEFPLFAADLANEPSLPALVLLLAEDPLSEKPGHVTDEVWTRVRRYAAGEVALDVLIASGDGAVSGDDAHDDGSASRSIISSQGQLLVRYLQKTRRIAGPGADLVFMEGVGSALGLPTALAVRLRAAATEGRVDDVVAAIRPLPEDQQVAAMHLLGLNAREALPGIEGANAVSTLLRTIGAMPDLDLSSIVDDLITATNVSIPTGGLARDDLLGALRLGLATSRPVGTELVSRTLSDDSVVEDEAIANFVAEHAGDFAATHISRMGDILAALLVDLNWENAAQAIVGWTDERGSELLDAARAPMVALIHSKAADAAQSPQADPAAQPPSTDVSPQATAINHALGGLRTLGDATREADRKALLESVLSLALNIDSQDARGFVVEMLPPLGEVASPALAREVLIASCRRTVEAKRPWFDALERTVVAGIADAKALLEGAVTSVWTMSGTFEGDKSAAIHDVALSASRLADAVDWFPAAELTAAVVGSAPLPSLDQNGVVQWELRVRAATILDDVGLLRAADWKTPYVEAATQLAASGAPDETARLKFCEVLLSTSALVAGSNREAVGQLFGTLRSSPSLHPGDRLLALARVAKEHRVDSEESLGLTPDDFVAVFDQVADEQQTAQLAAAVGTWLSGLMPTVEEAWTVISRYDFDLPEGLRAELSEYARRLSPAERTALAELSLGDFPNVVPSEVFLEAIGYSEGDLTAEVELLIEKLQSATNEEGRRGVFRLWGALKLTDRGLTQRLMEEVMLPLAGQGKSSRELVVQNLHLAESLPDGQKRRLAEAVQSNSDPDEWDRLSKQLLKARFMRESGGFLSRRRDHL
jgi:hypothetical protein